MLTGSTYILPLYVMSEISLGYFRWNHRDNKLFSFRWQINRAGLVGIQMKKLHYLSC